MLNSIPDIDNTNYPIIQKAIKTAPRILSNIICNNPNKQVKYIHHLADIHIRKSSERAIEYLAVFENLYKSIEKFKDNQSAVTVICGDIFHEKKDYDNKSLSLIFDLFEKISNLTPLFIIMGNHDGLISNKIKHDQLEWIVKKTQIKKHPFYYLKYGGIYQYHNLFIGISSLYDDINVYAHQIKLTRPDGFKIAFYHGSMLSCAYDNNFIASKCDKTSVDFYGYDYVLLGDIHKHQYLNKEKTIAYPGSLIQQSFGESIDNHGYIQWDLFNKKSEMIQITNSIGFLKVSVENNILITEIPNRLPIKIKVDIKYKNTQKRFCKELIKSQIESRGSEITMMRMEEYYQERTDREAHIYNNIDKKSYQKDLIADYCKELTYSQNSINDIVNFHQEISKSLDSHANIQKTHWKLIELRFDNMFSYGEGNLINFLDFRKNSIIGIIGPNHYGKSSIIDILLFALFNKCSRRITNIEIINNKKSSMQCQVIILSNNIYYRIKQKTVKNKSKSHRTYSLEESDDNSTYKLISTESINDCYKKIVKITGDYDSFIKCNVSLQEEVSFINMAPSKQINYLKQLSNLTIFDDFLKLAKEYQLKQAAVSGRLQEQLRDVSIENEKNTIAANQLTIKEKEDIIIVDTASIKSLENEINILNRRIETVNDYDARYKTKEECNDQIKLIIKENQEIYQTEKDTNLLYQSLQSQMDQINENEIIENNKKTIQKNNQLKNNLSEEIKLFYKKLKPLYNDVDEASILKKIQKFTEKINSIDQKEKLVNDKLKTLQSKIIIIDSNKMKEIVKESDSYLNLLNQQKEINIKKKSLDLQINKHKTHIANQKDIKYDKSCSYCVNNLDSSSKHLLNSLNDLVLKQTNQETLLQNVQKEIETKKEYYQQKLTLDLNLKTNSEVARKIEVLKNKIQKYSFDKSKCNNKIISCKEKKILIDQNVVNQKNNQIYESKIIEAQSSLQKIDLDVDNDYLKYMDNKKLLVETYQKLIDLRKEISQFDQKIKKIKKTLIHIKNTKILSKIKNLTNKKNNLSISIHEAQTTIGNLKMYNNSSKIAISIYQKAEKEFDQCSKNMEICKKYLSIVDRKGLPYSMLNNVINSINITANKYLESVTDFTIKISKELPGKKSKCDRVKSSKTVIQIYKMDAGEKLHISLCSGFEKFIISFAIRLALINSCNHHSTNFIAIDEGFSCMDQTNLSNMQTIMDKIKSNFDITLIVSHIDDMKSYCDQYIHVSKRKNNESFIN